MGRWVTSRIESAAPPRASPSSLVRTMPGDLKSLVKMGGDADGLLAGRGIRHEQDFARLEKVLQFLDLLDQRLVDFLPAGGVENLNVAVLGFRPIRAPAGRPP